MSVFVGKQRFDYDEYPMGSPGDKVGPFKNEEDAQQWIKDTSKYRFGYVRTPFGNWWKNGGRERIVIVDPFLGVTAPNEWRGRF